MFKRHGVAPTFGVMLVSIAAFNPSPASAELRPSSGIVRNPSAATGRAGSATLSARALIDKDSQTTLELTTGALDQVATPPGYISKVQIKNYDGEGRLVVTENRTPTDQSGYQSYTYSRYRRGESYEVQANIRGIDGNRTNVVTTAGVVLARPDLDVVSVNASNRAVVGMPVNILATVAELNGDVGATANCVLRENGVEIDRVNNIWVDGGSHADCLFTAEFESTGNKVLDVSVEGVTPGDWDTSNNTAQVTLEVLQLAGGYAAATYSGAITTFENHSTGWMNAYDGDNYLQGNQDWSFDQVDTYTTGSSSIVVTSPDEFIEFPFQVDATFSSDGVLQRSVSQAVPLVYDDYVTPEATVDVGLVDDHTTGINIVAIAFRFVVPGGAPPDPLLNGQDPGAQLIVTVFGSQRVFLSQSYLNAWLRYPDGSMDVYLQNDVSTGTEVQDGIPFASPQQSVTWEVTTDSNGYLVDRTVTAPVTAQTQVYVDSSSCADINGDIPELGYSTVGYECTSSYWAETTLQAMTIVN